MFLLSKTAPLMDWLAGFFALAVKASSIRIDACALKVRFSSIAERETALNIFLVNGILRSFIASVISFSFVGFNMF